MVKNLKNRNFGHCAQVNQLPRLIKRVYTGLVAPHCATGFGHPSNTRLKAATASLAASSFVPPVLAARWEARKGLPVRSACSRLTNLSSRRPRLVTGATVFANLNTGRPNMAQSSLTPVEFHGATLATTIINGAPCVALRPICEAIGLDWASQLQRIKRHAVLSSCMVITTIQVPSDVQAREVIMLPLAMLNGWLFGVSVGRARPELRERLTQYQAECFDALARHFGAAGAPSVNPPAGSGPVNVHALPAPDDSIDVRSLLLSGQSAPKPLTPAQQALIDRRAWSLAHDAYELIRQHLARRVAYRASSAQLGVVDGSALADIVNSTTLGHALAHEYRSELQRMESIARLLATMASENLTNVRKVTGAAGQGTSTPFNGR